MSYDNIKTSSVIFYPYLWRNEADRGETEGRKDRRTAVGFRLPRPDGLDVLILFPITTVEPAAGVVAIEVPETEKQRAGLDRQKRMWIILDEYNSDVIGLSLHLEPVEPVGQFSAAFFHRVLETVRPLLGARIRSVSRIERP